ncbi:MAG: ATP-binding protein, partial [Actinomycetota bacterium]
MSLRAVVKAGGVSTVLVLTLLNLVDEFEWMALAVLSPDVQRSLHLSDAAIGAISGVQGLLVVTGALPLGYLADRVRRTRLVGFCSLLWACVAVGAGLVRNAWQLVIARILSGIGKANALPVHSGLLADAYPLAGRARVFAVHGLANPIGIALAPLLAGGIATLAGGAEGWRWAFILLAIPGFVLALFAFRLREPRRGRNEHLAVLGATAEDAPVEIPIPLSTGFARLKKIRSFSFLLTGLGVLGFALFSVPTFFNLMLEERYGLDAFGRGVAGSLTFLGAIAAIPISGMIADRLFRKSPPRVVGLIAGGIAGYGLVFAASLYLPKLPLVLAGVALAQALANFGFTPIFPVIAAVSPYRLRSLGFAMVGIYIFLFGAFFGGIIAGMLSDAFGERTALTIVVPPSALIGASLIALGGRHIRRDISLVVEELKEEQEERARMGTGAEAPVLQVRNLDFSYGQVQVLFDVALDVRRGEVLALLGTNGAGKSTLLRTLSGLAMPDRGVIRLNGRTITYTEAETRVDLGIVQVPSGKALFGSLTVGENLQAGAYSYIWDRERVEARTEEVLELFPALRPLLQQPAATLSGGEQQMLALGKALLLDPEVLLIDELSLGLAPVVVQELLVIIERLKERGITIVVVEQSVNVALTIADRAVFMEKGQIRFEGPAGDLLARDDLVRAVFLGAEGG